MQRIPPSTESNAANTAMDKYLAITNGMEIRCVGNVILVNTTRLAPPYEILAIGDPQELEDAISTSTTYLDNCFCFLPQCR